MRKAALALLLALSLVGVASADITASSPQVENGNLGWIVHDRNDVLLIRTTDVAINRALNDLGVPFDDYLGSDFSGLDLSGYTHVIVAMDGGQVEEPSIVNVANFASGGGALHFYGGTALQPYVLAMNTHLLQNQTGNFYWTISGTPHSTILDPGHCLAAGLPATYNFSNTSAAYYQLRETDPLTSDAAVNGDGINHLLSKPIGSGTFDICINSPYNSYYNIPSDYDWLKQVVENMVGDNPSPLLDSTWGEIKALYR